MQKTIPIPTTIVSNLLAATSFTLAPYRDEPDSLDDKPWLQELAEAHNQLIDHLNQMPNVTHDFEPFNNK